MIVSTDLKIGERVLWRCTHRGYYNFVRYYEAYVARINAKTIKIELTRPDGTIDTRNVRPENLTNDFSGFHKVEKK